MLKQRIITAVILLAILLPALFYRSPVPFCAVALVLIGAGAWEWGRLNQSSQATSLLLAAVCMAACGMAWYAGLLTERLTLLWSLAGAAWVLCGAMLLKVGVPGWGALPRPLRLAGGIFALWLAWLAVSQARFIGISFLLSILLLVWVADISAYFAGKAFGTKFTKTKLAPTISPGKSWEGVWGAMAGVIVLGWVWMAFNISQGTALGQQSFYAIFAQRHGVTVMLLAVIFLGAMSVVGDLVESLIKRSAGAKDSSGLLPGHGGVLDRVDALLPVLPLAMMLASI